jgi:hypothetical protein
MFNQSTNAPDNERGSLAALAADRVSVVDGAAGAQKEL